MNLRQIFFLRRVYKKEVPQMQALLAGGQWVNLAILLASLLNDAAGIFPGLQTAHWFTATQAILGILLPSVGGLSHKIQGTQVVPAAK